MNNEIIVIPVKVDFLLIRPGAEPHAEAKVDFSKMPYNNGQEDVNSEFAFISENFLSQPFQNNNLFLQPGLHLHWSLPKAFTSGEIAAKEENHITHSQVPNRWIINRYQNGELNKSWIVESDYLHPEFKNNTYHSISYPLGHSDRKGKQPFRYMGRSFCFFDANNKWTTKIPKHPDTPEYLNHLTAVGYGEPTFAAFYPNCHSVFGFRDSDINSESDLSNFEYEVLGYFGQNAKDPVTSPIHQKFGAFEFHKESNRIIIPNRTSSIFTLEAWIKTSDESLTGNQITDGNGIIWTSFTEEDENFVIAILNNRIVYFEGPEKTMVRSNQTINDNEWHHVSVVRNGSTQTIELYVDGRLEGKNKCQNIPLNKHPQIHLGLTTVENTNFRIKIADFRIWNIARIHDDIQSSMLNEIKGSPSGLIGYYTFGEGLRETDDTGRTFIPDHSENSNDGEILKSTPPLEMPIWEGFRNGESSALNFNGQSNFVQVESGLQSFDELTIETWVRLKNKNTWNTILNFDHWAPGFVHFQFAPNGRLEFSINANSPTDLYCSFNFELNKWYHIAVTYSELEKSLRFFVNGSLIDEFSYSTIVPLAADIPYRIGGWNPGNRFFDGDISELKIWSKKRSSEEIRINMHTRFSSPQNGLVAYYKFNQGIKFEDNKTNKILLDSSGNNHHGLLNNFSLEGTESNWTEGNPILELSDRLFREFQFKLNSSEENISSYDFSSICYSRLKFRNVSQSSIGNTASIALGNTGTEAISAWLSLHLPINLNNKRSDIEKKLGAIQMISQLAGKKLDIGPVFDEIIHEKGFSPVTGGTIWNIEIESISDLNQSNKGKKSGIEITLPESFAHTINELNETQQKLDKTQDELISLRRLLYADWCKYMVAAYHSDVEPNLPQMDDIRFFIENYSFEEINQKESEIQAINQRIQKTLGEIKKLEALFNSGYQFENIIFEPDGSINQEETSTFSFRKKIRSITFEEDPIDIIKEKELGLRNVKDFDGNNSKEYQIILPKPHDFIAISFWINISGHQPLNEENKPNLRQLIQLKNGDENTAIPLTLISSNDIGLYWNTIMINGINPVPYQTYTWDDFPKDSWVHVYLQGGSNFDIPLEITLMKGLKGKLAKINLFREGLTSMELFCDRNMLCLKELKLKQKKGPRYWQPNEPVLLIEGEIATSSERFVTGKNLPCLHVEGSIAGRFMDISQNGFSVKEDGDEYIETLKEISRLGQKIYSLANQFPSFYDIITSEPLYSQPWHPLMLEWKIGIVPIEKQSGTIEGKINPLIINQNYRLESDLPDFTSAISSDQHYLKIFTGSTILTPHAKNRMLHVIENYLKSLHGEDKDWKKYNPSGNSTFVNPFLDNQGEIDEDAVYNAGLNIQADENNPITLALSSYVQLKDRQFLSQSLGGFNSAMLMLHQTFQMPIEDPIGFKDDQSFAKKVREYVDKESKWSPLPLFEFDPIRMGHLELLGINIIDTFGQIKQVFHEDQPVNPDIYFANTIQNGYLKPRISQPARLNFRWLSSDNDELEMNEHPASSPVCGWLVPNHLDDSIVVYDRNGNALGSINESQPKWRSVPGDSYPIDIQQIPNERLKMVVLQIMNLPELTDFMEILETTMDQIDPENFARHTDIALLMGRPIAVVRASVSLDVKGNVAVNQDWSSFEIDMEESINQDHFYRKGRKTNEWEHVKFPIRIGEHGRLNDAVLGYWKDSDTSTFCSILSKDAINTPFGKSSGSKGFDSKNPDILLSISNAPAKLTLLIDPRGTVHGASGILPTKAIKLPENQFKSALQKMSITFSARPILMPDGKITIPLPNEPGYDWSWIVEKNKRWVETGTTGIVYQEKFERSFKEGKKIWEALLNKGWIDEIENGKALVRPVNKRKNPDPHPLLITQLENIQNILDEGHIVPPDYSGHVYHRNVIKEGWLKLRNK